MGHGRRAEIVDGIQQVFCTHCKQYKPIDNFNLRTPLLGLYQYYCKACQAAIDKANNENQLQRRGGRKLVRRIPDSDESYCSHCKQWKPKSEFNFWNRSEGILQYYCRDCQHQVDREHFLAHKERILGRNKKNMTKNRQIAVEFLYELLKGARCADCGTDDSRVLTFDHVRGEKEYDISAMVAKGMTLESVRKEINKTEIVCFNCHMKREQDRRKSYRSLW